MQIPHKTIQTLFRLDLLFRLLVVGIERFIERLDFVARIFANHGAGRIQDFNSYFILFRSSFFGFGAGFR